METIIGIFKVICTVIVSLFAFCFVAVALGSSKYEDETGDPVYDKAVIGWNAICSGKKVKPIK